VAGAPSFTSPPVSGGRRSTEGPASPTQSVFTTCSSLSERFARPVAATTLASPPPAMGCDQSASPSPSLSGEGIFAAAAGPVDLSSALSFDSEGSRSMAVDGPPAVLAPPNDSSAHDRTGTEPLWQPSPATPLRPDAGVDGASPPLAGFPPSVGYDARGWTETVVHWRLSPATPSRLVAGVSFPSRSDRLSPSLALSRSGVFSAVVAPTSLPTDPSLTSDGEKEDVAADPLVGSVSADRSGLPLSHPSGDLPPPDLQRRVADAIAGEPSPPSHSLRDSVNLGAGGPPQAQTITDAGFVEECSPSPFSPAALTNLDVGATATACSLLSGSASGRHSRQHPIHLPCDDRGSRALPGSLCSPLKDEANKAKVPSDYEAPINHLSVPVRELPEEVVRVRGQRVSRDLSNTTAVGAEPLTRRHVCSPSSHSLHSLSNLSPSSPSTVLPSYSGAPGDRDSLDPNVTQVDLANTELPWPNQAGAPATAGDVAGGGSSAVVSAS